FAKQDGETLVIVTADHETGGLAINPESKMRKLKLAFTTNDHTSTMIPVFAFGPQAELFGGIYDNTKIYDKMMQAFQFMEKERKVNASRKEAAQIEKGTK
ncbi:MAG: alkaline phosphatase, partial [Bacteroidota bacterium]